jgi:5-methylcytosine-specific restriction endonuclease McrA
MRYRPPSTYKQKPITSKIRRSATKSYGSREQWQELRAKVLLRDGYRCRDCGSVSGLTVDHIIPIAQGGRSVVSNLRTLCYICHGKKPRHYKVRNLLKGGASYRKRSK